MAGRGGRATLLMQMLQLEEPVRPGGSGLADVKDLATALPQVGRGSQAVAPTADPGSSAKQPAAVAAFGGYQGTVLSGPAAEVARPTNQSHQNALQANQQGKDGERHGITGAAHATDAKAVFPGGGRGAMLAAILDVQVQARGSPKDLSPADSIGSCHLHAPPPTAALMGCQPELESSPHFKETRRQAAAAAAATDDGTQQAAGDMTSAMVRAQKGVVALKDVKLGKPEKGTQGTPQPMVANYVRLQSQNAVWYQYQVTFKPELESRSMRTKMLCDQARIGRAKIFDGSILFLPYELPMKLNVYQAIRDTDGVQVIIEVVLTKTLKPGDQACVHTYNVLFKRIQNALKLVQVGRHCYDYEAKMLVPQHKLEIWPGYVTAVKEHEGGLLLVCDVSHRVLRMDTVHDVLTSIAHSRPPISYQDACTRALVGSTVLTRYNNKTYRIDDIDFSMSPMSHFDMRGQPVSFFDYYQRHYAVTIKDREQPLLISRAKRRDQDCKTELICLVPELCCMTGLTDDMRQDFRIMKDLATHTRVTPAHRSHAIKKFLSRVNSSPEAVQMLSDWGLRLESVTLQLEGRVYDPETIMFRNNQFSAGSDAAWLRHISNNPAITSVSVKDWLLVYSNGNSKQAVDFVTKYRQCGPAMGIDVAEPVRVIVQDDRTESYIRSIRSNVKPQTQCVVIILPTRRDDRYNALKKLLTVDCPVPSQVIQGRTLGQQQKLTAIVQRVGLQINCKLGGELWAVPIPLKNLMIVGIDVYHDKDARTGSVAGLVATINSTLTRCYSRVSIQGKGEEIISGLKPCLLAALRKYYEVNHVLPDKIIVYRDGVGDGMLPVVGSYETEQLLSTFKSFTEGYNPQLAVVVVQKRINTRLFSQLSHREDDLGNPRPGSVIDHTITKKDWYDFFLVSQHVTQGTVSPTHYVVVYNDTSLKADHMQKLAYKTTHLYYNWPGTIRVPAHCQYAHKLAYFVGQNTKQEAKLDLADRLYYL